MAKKTPPKNDSIKSFHQFKVPVSELELGMFVSELDRPWVDTPFLFQGFLLERLDDIRTLQEICEYVYIDIVEETRVPQSKERKTPQKQRCYINKINTEKELPKANQAFSNAKLEMQRQLDAIKLGQAVDIKQTKAAVSACVDSILRNQSAMLYLSKIKQSDEQTADHSLQVCILSISFAKHLGLAEFEMENIGVCALLHDVGKVKIPSEILKKNGPLTEEEMSIYQRHTIYGRKLLMSKASVYPGIVDIAYCHHERVDGKGFPRGIPADKIPYFAKIIAIANDYASLTTGGRQGLPRSSLETLRILFERRNHFYDSALVIHFIQLMGVCPPGNIVEMSNGEVGVILSTDSRYKLRPKVLLMLDQYKQPGTRTVADLAKGAVDFFGRPYVIRHIHPNGAYGLNVNDLEL